ncbi:hypothetical protein [Planobacterium oryzisoli]|uniref:Uncharacterized protein n=1 Tax=Planobacterium oryzisoli TaxID=2771435 RepID=A0A930YVC3_9FLAO|nr:hypothetical protein [Planobacterium oryzisoli]MBF5027059.1 hypothetical protein [Planobacterium oryzisoli]
MKKFNALTRIQFFLLSMFASVMAFAQEAADDLNVDVDVDDATAGGDWMSNPLVWVIGALVLILIIALVARGGGSRD